MEVRFGFSNHSHSNQSHSSKYNHFFDILQEFQEGNQAPSLEGLKNFVI